jgi:hypothetical protein
MPSCKSQIMNKGKLYPVIFVFIIMSFFSVSSCVKSSSCEEPPDVSQSSLVVTFKDRSSGRYLYSEADPLYDKDSIKIADPSGILLSSDTTLATMPNTSDRYYVINFGNFYNQQTDQGSFDSEICKSFVVWYSYNETDTIKTCFKSKRIKCGSVFEILKVYYKNQLLTTVSNETFAEIIIIKN